MEETTDDVAAPIEETAPNTDNVAAPIEETAVQETASRVLPCVICFEEWPRTEGLVCDGSSSSNAHMLCAECLNSYMPTLFGCVELQQREGGLACVASNCTHSQYKVRLH
eukprot:4608023-Prymnesium_polylepis.3